MRRLLTALVVLLTAACAQSAAPTPVGLFVTPVAPVIQTLGEPITLNNTQSAADPGLAVDSSGAPVIIWLEGDELIASRWDGTAWSQLGDKPLNTQPGSIAAQPAITAAPDGKIAVVWRECCRPDGNLYVAQWDGTAWMQLGAELDAYADDLDQPTPAIINTPAGLVVAWRERDVVNNTHQMIVRRWDGSAWVPLGEAESLNNDPAKAVQQLTLTTLPNGNPVALWAEWNGFSAPIVQGRVWDGTEWAKLPAPKSELDETLGALSLDVTQDDQAFVSLDAQDGPLIETMAVTDSEWHKIGFPLELKAEQHSCIAAPALIADKPSSIVMIWADTCRTSVSLSNWNGTAWTPPHTLVSASSQYDADDYTITESADGKVYLAWLEDVDGISQVHVASYG